MIKVLKGYDGIKQGTVIETIERKGRHYGDTRKGNQRRYEVSYKGKWYGVFILPACYGESSGHCISID